MALAAAALVVGLAGPAAYSLQTASTTHSGSIPSAGPAVAGGRGSAPVVAVAAARRPDRHPYRRHRRVHHQAGGLGGPTAAPVALVARAVWAACSTPAPPARPWSARLQSHASAYTWVAATVGSNSAAGLQLSSGEPVMAIGGFNGTDPTPTLAAFEADVAAGRIHYFTPGNTGGGSSSTGTGTQITAWVESHFTKVTVGTTTLYDLTQPTTSTTSTHRLSVAVSRHV